METTTQRKSVLWSIIIVTKSRGNQFLKRPINGVGPTKHSVVILLGKMDKSGREIGWPKTPRSVATNSQLLQYTAELVWIIFVLLRQCWTDRNTMERSVDGTISSS